MVVWEHVLQKNVRKTRCGGQIIFKRSDIGKGQCIRMDGCDSITGTDSGWKNVEAAN